MRAPSPPIVRPKNLAIARSITSFTTAGKSKSPYICAILARCNKIFKRLHCRITKTNCPLRITAAASKSDVQEASLSWSVFASSFYAEYNPSSAISWFSTVCTILSAFEWNQSAHIRSFIRQTSAFFDAAPAHYPFSTRSSSINIGRAHMEHSMRGNRPKALSESGNPAQLTKLWILDRTLPHYSSPETEAEGVSTKF